MKNWHEINSPILFEFAGENIDKSLVSEGSHLGDDNAGMQELFW